VKPFAPSLAVLALFAVHCASKPTPPPAGAAASGKTTDDAAAPSSSDEPAAADGGSAEPAPDASVAEAPVDGKTTYAIDAAAPKDDTSAIILIGQLNEADPTSAGIAKTVREKIARLRACYAQGLAAKPGIHGKLKLKFTVERDGTVSKVEDGGSTLKDPDTVGCVMQTVKAMKFPKPMGVASVTLPLIFRAR
jgi:outer membrane biosynthesis protein TonB